MKRKKLSKMKILVLGFACLISYFSLNAADLHVGSGQTYSTIQAAVDAAGSGDVIVIHGGTYRESVEISTNGITIQANGTDSVVINGTEPLLSWTDEGNGVYSTTMDWDISEGEQTNQIFVDGEMIHFARWPDQTSNDIVMNPIMAEMDGVEEIDFNTGEITDFEFENENSARWEDASIYINLSNPDCKKDGQGWTGPVKDIVDGKIRTQAAGSGRYKACDNWSIGHGSRYYLFNPTPSAVAATGGVDSLLSNGEWWKNGDTLYVRMPDGGAPASSLGNSNLVEAKKYPYAFRPGSGTFSNVTIKDLNLFATSITTDKDYLTRASIADASNNVLDNLNVKYVTHSYDCSGNWQQQWNGKSGIILSGSDNVLKNSTIVYSSASAVSIIGKGNKLLNNFIHDVNYNVTESGAVNCGDRNRNSISVDHIIAYNTIYNTTHSGISTRNFNEYGDDVTPGQARIHHNVFYDCLSRVYDAGIVDGNKNKHGLRIDHNIMYDSPDHLQIGIYLDYGEYVNDDFRIGNIVIDHNVIYNVDRPIQPNACSFLKIFNNTVQATSNHSIGGVNLEDSAVFIQNNFGIPDDFGEYAVMSRNFATGTAINNNYFTDAANGDFSLTSNAVEAIDSGANVAPYNGLVNDAPDIGAYEYGKTKWTAGATTTPITTYELALSASNGGKVFPGNGPIRDGEVFAIEAEDVLGAAFNQWSGDVTGSENPKEITMNSDITAVGEFNLVPTYDLNIEVTNGSVRIFPGGGTYNTGTDVKLTASPDSEAYYFSDWSGGIADTANPVTVTMDNNYTITANFGEYPTYTLDITANNGTIRKDPDQAEYIEGTVVNITAVADTDYKFVNWTGDASVSDSIFRQDITMDHDITLTAHFVSTAGMDELNSPLSGVNIYPNPNDGEEVNILLNGKSKRVEVCIYNLTGSKLYSGTFNSNTFSIPVSEVEEIKNGYYLLEIKSNNQIIRKKLIID